MQTLGKEDVTRLFTAPKPLIRERIPEETFLLCAVHSFMKQEHEAAKSEQAMKQPLCKSVYLAKVKNTR